MELEGNKQCIEIGSKDLVDYPPNNYVFRKRDSVFLVAGVISYIADWVLDILTAYNHWTHGNKNWFYLTVIFVVFPSVVVNLISFWWYAHDGRKERRLKEHLVIKWSLRFIFLFFQLGLILRYIECLWYGMKSRKAWQNEDRVSQREYYMLMLYVDADCVLLRLIESFMESVPQLMLQLYILFQLSPHSYGFFWGYFLWLTCITSLFNVSWGVAAYHRDSRFTDYKKRNLSLAASCVLLFWQFFSIGSRVIALVLFASLFKLWVFAVCVPHWILMVSWLLARRSFSHIESLLYEVFLSLVFAAVFVFTYINDRDEPTRNKYATFYVLCGIENSAMMCLWLIYGNGTTWYYYFGMLAHYFFFLMGLITMLLYYGKFHPTVPDMRRSNYVNNSTTASNSSPLSLNLHNEFHQMTPIPNGSLTDSSILKC